MQKILVIEDELSLQYLYAEILDGFEVTQALTGHEALEILDGQSDYDLYVVDIHLHDLDGFEIIRKIRSKNAAAKVIIGTGFSLESLSQKIAEVHPNFVFSKPFKVLEFRNKVKELISAG
jgi:CheY-like chemotaxis protein